MGKMRKGIQKTRMMIVGSILLLAGITLVLMWWNDVLALFRGFAGMALAVGGLVVLYMIKE